MRSRYFSDTQCIKRLIEEYKAHKKLIVALDFDDTVFDFHKQGDTYEQVLDVVRRSQKLGFYVVLFTGSVPEKYPECIKYLLENGITVDSINQNPIPLPFGNHGKPYYNILLDDRAGLYAAYVVLETVVHLIEQGQI